MESIVDRAKQLGIQFNAKERKAAELQTFLFEAEQEMLHLQEEGEDTSLHAITVDRVRQALRSALQEL